MKTFSNIFESYSKEQIIQQISSKVEFSLFVHETLQSKPDYSVDRANVVVEQLSQQYNDDWCAAAKELENFQ